MNHTLVYFSPTGNTKRIVEIIAYDMDKNARNVDITDNQPLSSELVFSENDFALIGIPVYSGRVPRLAGERISLMKGNRTPVALVATFGNRHYDDSLLELKTLVEHKGFIVVSAAAFVAQHSVVPRFGAGRPDEKDTAIIHGFAEKLNELITTWSPESHSDLNIPGNPRFRKYRTIPMKPHANSSCNMCGLCAKRCPAQAISADNPRSTDKKSCIVCVRCIQLCPQQARGFYWVERFVAEKSIAKMCHDYKKPEVFI